MVLLGLLILFASSMLFGVAFGVLSDIGVLLLVLLTKCL